MLMPRPPVSKSIRYDVINCLGVLDDELVYAWAKDAKSDSGLNESFGYDFTNSESRQTYFSVYLWRLAIQVQLSFRTEFLNLAVPLTVLESVGYKISPFKVA